MLNLDLTTILAEILNFLVLAAALYFLAFKPIVKRIEERAEEKQALLREAQEKQEEADKKLVEINDRLENIDAEIEERLEDAYDQAQAESESLLEATEKEAQHILEEAEREAANRKKNQMEENQEKLVETVLQISGDLLKKTTPDSTHHQLVEDLNSEIWELGKSDMRQVRAIRESLAERTPTVYVTAAQDLDPDHQRALVRTFSALADTNVNMEIEIDPELIAGVRVRMGDLVVENTLAMELTELKEDVINALEESFNVEQ